MPGIACWIPGVCLFAAASHMSGLGERRAEWRRARDDLFAWRRVTKVSLRPLSCCVIPVGKDLVFHFQNKA